MNARRTVIIAAALALAALAFIGNIYYLNSAQQRAYGDAKLVKVFVVKKDIPKGTTGDTAIGQDYVRADQIPLQYHPSSAITDINDIKGKVAINNLTLGQIVVTGQFVDPNVAQVTTAQQVPAGQVAISVSVDQVHGVAGLLLPGDKVDVLVVGKDATDDKKTYTQVMYQNVNIMAIGTKTAPQAGQTTATTTAATGDTGLITFSVPLDAAQRLALVGSGQVDGASLYLALVPPDNTPATPPAAVTSLNVLSNLPLTPYPNS